MEYTDKNNTNNTMIQINKTILSIIALGLILFILFSMQFKAVDASSSSLDSSAILNSVNQNILYLSISATSFPPMPLLPELTPIQINSSINRTCILTPSLIEAEGTPQQMEGPYFIDGMPNRSDIRTDPSDGVVEQGIPLNLIIHVYMVNKKSNSCMPLAGAQVDIWHANSQGVYSSVNAQGTEGKKFLRGYQVTDDNGTVRFTTVYPGWYEGRAIHIHDKVRLFNGSDKVIDWTSQLYMNDSINQQVHLQTPYSNHGIPDTTNDEDFIYRGPSSDNLVQTNSGRNLMLNLTKEGQGYTGTFNIVLNSTRYPEQ